MPVFVCDSCHAIDNTACGGNYWDVLMKNVKVSESIGVADKVGSASVLCCECHTGKWHDQFPKVTYVPGAYDESEFKYVPKTLRRGYVPELPPLPPSAPVLFSGEHAEEYEAVHNALFTAAADADYKGEDAVYDWLTGTPKTSLTVELVDALRKNGFHIRKKGWIA